MYINPHLLPLSLDQKSDLRHPFLDCVFTTSSAEFESCLLLIFSSLVDSLFSWCPVYSITSSILALCDPPILLLFSGASSRSPRCLRDASEMSLNCLRISFFCFDFALKCLHTLRTL
ncbi:hypothetical protein E4U35_002680 [Claviceps purpurea]|nr:hypothetical protein E4U35_002680 [Claviceps purpurea]